MSKVRDSYNALNMVGRETDSVRYGIPWRHSAPPRTLAELWFMRHGGSASWKNAPPSRYRYRVADETAFAEADHVPNDLVTYLVSLGIGRTPICRTVCIKHCGSGMITRAVSSKALLQAMGRLEGVDTTANAIRSVDNVFDVEVM